MACMLFLIIIFKSIESADEQLITCGIRYQKLNSGAANISECIFYGLKSEQNGGAICINSLDITARIEYTSFDNCSALGDNSFGGAMFVHARLCHTDSICGSYCSAQFGELFAFENDNCEEIILNSTSASHCFVWKIEGTGIVDANSYTFKLNYFNISSASNTKNVFGFKFTKMVNTSLQYMTAFNMSNTYFIIVACDASDFAMDNSNIVGNDGNAFTAMRFNEKKGCNLCVHSCVFADNNFRELFKIESALSNVTIEECLISQECEIISGASARLSYCRFDATETLSFYDNNIVSGGISCGIRYPSPSFSPSLSQSQSRLLSTTPTYLSGGAISLIVIGLIALFSIFGAAIWFYTKRSAWRRYGSDANTVSLLRNLENDYG